MPTDAHQRVLALGSRQGGTTRTAGTAGRARWGRTLLALVLALGLIGGGLYAAVNFIGLDKVAVRQKCTALVGSTLHTLSPDQASNAALIAAVATRRGMPTRAATIGIATSMQESKLTNIDYGDNAGPDSRGLFQQRPSMGWGTQAQVMDPVYAANRFFQELATFDYASMSLTDAAQKVQRSRLPGGLRQARGQGAGVRLRADRGLPLDAELHPAPGRGRRLGQDRRRGPVRRHGQGRRGAWREPAADQGARASRAGPSPSGQWPTRKSTAPNRSPTRDWCGTAPRAAGSRPRPPTGTS